MKLLVTGGAGFIGSAVVRRAVASGWSVVNVDSLTYASSLGSIGSIGESERYEFEHVDIRDRDALETVFFRHCPDAVIHLAAESHVDRSIDGPGTFISTNVLGTFALLETAQSYWHALDRFSNFRFHHVSTDEVFGSLPSDPSIKFTESTAYDPRSPYSASKASSDHLVRAFHHTYGLPIVITNCSNNYGPYQFPEKLIPTVIINAMHGCGIPIYGDGQNVRDWLYVEDHAQALLAVLRRGSVGESYNVGGNSEATNIDIVRMICRILDDSRPMSCGCHFDLVEFVIDRPGHDRRYAIDTSKVRRELGWTPSVKLWNGLEATVDWYLNNEDWWRPIIDREGVGRRLGVVQQ